MTDLQWNLICKFMSLTLRLLFIVCIPQGVPLNNNQVDLAKTIETLNKQITNSII